MLKFVLILTLAYVSDVLALIWNWPSSNPCTRISNLEDMIQQNAKVLRTSLHDIEQKISSLQKSILEIKEPAAHFEKIGSRFFYIEPRVTETWFGAGNTCRQMGGHLANIESRMELDALLERIDDAAYWISFNDLDHQGVFTSSATGEKASVLTWAPGEPNNNRGTQHCVTLFAKKYMDDDHCTLKYRFICQAENNKAESSS